MSKAFTLSQAAVEDILIDYLRDIILEDIKLEHPEDQAYFDDLRKAACVIHNYMAEPSQWLSVKHLPLD